MKPLDVKEFEKLPFNKQNEIRKEIIKNNELESIPVFYLPNPVSKEYYFISYSHKNYKEVYLDLFELESVGFPFWYDRGIPAGNNWKDVAIKYLEPFDCKGVVFYISEEALVSDAINEEIKFTLENEKPFIVIYLGNDKSLIDLIERLFKEKKINEDRYNFYLETFPEEVIYLKYQEPAATKKEKIINNLPRQKLLSLLKDEEGNYYSNITSFDVEDEVVENDEEVQYIKINAVDLSIDGSNDFYVKEIKESDYIDVLSLLCNEYYIDYDTEAKIKFSKNMKVNNVDLKCFIDKFAFANLHYLEKVILPYSVEIEECAFGRAKRLKEVKFVDFGKQERNVVIKDFAFSGCESIESFDFSFVTIINEGAFRNCHNLKAVSLSGKYQSEEIPFSTFSGCVKLEKVSLIDNIQTIGEMAFYCCSSLKSIKMPKELKTIRTNAFASCSKLTAITFNDKIEVIDEGAFSFVGLTNNITITLPKSLKYIGKSAFIYSKINKITYQGTHKQFMEIAKDCFELAGKNDIDFDQIEVVCEDKTIRVIHIPDQDLYPWEMDV